MAEWVNEVSTSQGGNISMKVAGGYTTVTRVGNTISCNIGSVLSLLNGPITQSLDGMVEFVNGLSIPKEATILILMELIIVLLEILQKKAIRIR